MSDELTNDAELVSRWRRGEGYAAAVLLRRHQAAVWNFLLRQVRHRALAEDLLQETFLRVHRRLGEYEETGRFRALLFRIARNLCIDHYRRTSRLAEIELSLEPAAQGNPETDSMAGERVDRLRKAISDLPELQREVVLLHTYSGLTFREIAEIQGCPLGTTLGRMHYALKRLRKALPRQEWIHEL